MPKEAGVWYDDTGKGAVKIEPCGNKLCGRIVWLKNLVNDKGEPLIDRHNPDSKLSSRPICGLQVVGQLEAMPEGGFDNGWIYDPKEGKSYSVAITLSGPDQLSVTGYKGVKFLSKTFIWTRAKTDLPSCAAASPTEAKVTPAVPAAAAVPAAVAPAAKAPAKAAVTTSPTPAPAKPQKAGTAEALPWADGAAKPAPAAPKGASNLGASGVRQPKALPAAKPTVTKTAVTPQKSTAAPAPKPSKSAVPAAQKPAPAKPKPVLSEPSE